MIKPIHSYWLWNLLVYLICNPQVRFPDHFSTFLESNPDMFTVEKVRKYRESFLEPQSASTGSLCFIRVFHHFKMNVIFVARMNMRGRSISVLVSFKGYTFLTFYEIETFTVSTTVCLITGEGFVSGLRYRPNYKSG